MTGTDINQVIKEHGPALLAYAIRLTGGDRHLAEDVLQETWLRAWKNADRLTEELGSIRGWLRRIAHNVAIDLHRSRKARPTEVNLSDPMLHNAATVADPTDLIDTRIDLDEALEKLSPSHRTTVKKIYFEDRTTATAASMLGIPAGTVKSRIHNALNNLRAAMAVPSSQAA
ncbi:sigma-70 family RNA polymerase sigma factor [Thermocrispum agreste]|uniref:sigma-70 family RNA polymerase sigma factor n=1 Tax=Thermocrispum agreste TaxID=37925 RepID=UPI000405ECD3|nr:sigma-70 family RNA polymerase sigma factor [Thermocrispum agreste]